MSVVAGVPDRPTLSYTNITRALLGMAADSRLSGRRVLVTAENGWKARTPYKGTERRS
ncbi:hypothetical protein NRF20_42660 [Streptomyces sp. R-74717]|uniref:hypothetical protein n=1 Tax=Streptomyces sp. R-74717 TaxID=2969820 RepID=UPI0039B40C7C